MALANAHEGYEYQDLLTCFFILKEILHENQSQFIIDRKEFAEDKIDDLSISNQNGVVKIQIKYSNQYINHTFSKKDLSSASPYQLSLDALFNSWQKHPTKNITEFRLCLSWKEPIDDLINILIPINDKNTFHNFPTKVYKVSGVILWPQDKQPIASWKRLKLASNNIDRNDFLEFCDKLLIEIMMPKLSLDLFHPGELERLVIEQVQSLGIGIFPNTHWKIETFVMSLLAIIKRTRVQGTSLTTVSLFNELNIRTDYGSIEQNFPIIKKENLPRKSSLEEFVAKVGTFQKTILLGEPGSGKSWFIENLSRFLKERKINVIRHYCFTNLDDTFQKERIKLDVFFGNIIVDILKSFPQLKKIKKEKFASNLSELNHLLQSIEEPTYLIIDGLDHIERIINFRSFPDFSQQDVAIIECIEKLKVSIHVKVIIASQNIPELANIVGFEKMSLPNWTKKDVKNMLRNSGIENIQVKNGITLTAYLLEKSNGNPLYLKFLIDEIKKTLEINISILERFPKYSFNLSNYYEYILSRLNTREDVARVLCGVNFSLTKGELEEITGSGSQVVESLNILSPILRLNIAQNGYLIYHESFRRYIVDHLKSKLVSVERTIFEPIRIWFDSKDFFSHRKTYRNYLQFLFDGNSFKKILLYFNHKFVTESVLNGQPWDLIEKNYSFFVKAACSSNDFPNIILLNEVNKILSTTKENLYESFSLYLDAIGKIHGFNFVSEYLLFEGNITLPYEDGIKACYICDDNDIVAPWEPYMQQFNLTKKIEPDLFKYYLRGLLVQRKELKLNSIAQTILKKTPSASQEFKEELNKYKNRNYANYLIDKYPNIKRVSDFKPSNKIRFTISELTSMADAINNIDRIYSGETELITNFCYGLKQNAVNDDFFLLLQEKFKSKNWFYNWLIYYIRIIRLQSIKQPKYSDIKAAFNYLQYNMEPFLGHPRTTDLYSLHPFIERSLSEGLNFVQSFDEWTEIIEILVKVSNETTTSIQRSITGPLATDTLFKLLSNFITTNNILQINQALQQMALEKEEYHLHTDIAEYNLRLASLFCMANEKNKAIAFFKKGIEFLLAYTFRKDLTLVDAIEGIVYYSKIYPEQGLEDLGVVEQLVNSVVHHTDGKETHHFPVSWFKSFLEIDYFKAGLHLRNQLKDCRFDWRAEQSLVNFLCASKGDVDSEIEAYLSLTLPINDSDKFIEYRLNLCDSLEKIDNPLSDKIMAGIIPQMQLTQNRSHSDKLITKFNLKMESANYQTNKVPLKKNINDFDVTIKDMKPKADIHKFSNMGYIEMTEYINSQDILIEDLDALSHFFHELIILSDLNKDLISLIVTRNNKKYSDKFELDLIFNTGNDIECYYWVCRFVDDFGGWFEKFVNKEAFLNACKINKEKAFNFLFELIPSLLDINFNSSFSSNLIQLLAVVSYDNNVIQSMWKNLLTVTSYRLPFQEKIEWKNLFSNDLSMNKQELLICILICRYRGGTTERYMWTTTALANLMNDRPDQMIKPLIWFFNNQQMFLKSAITIVLQLILKQKEKDCIYHLNFKDLLLKTYPTRFFIIDFIISHLYDLKLTSFKLPKGLFYPNIERGLHLFLIRLNKRYRILEDSGLDIEYIFQKYVAKFNVIYKDYFELYQNRSCEKIVSHVYGSECMLELINSDFYDDLRHWSEIEDNYVFRLANFFNIDGITAQANSFSIRPSDLKKPFDLDCPGNYEEQIQKGNWIRLGHYEQALEKHRISKSPQFESFGGITFSRDYETEIPYSSYDVFTFQLWDYNEVNFEIDENITFFISQTDGVEHMKIIWLNPTIVRRLGLKTQNDKNGLVAVNNANEVILKMRTWKSNYIGDSFRTVLADEIPTLEGVDLLLRCDYFSTVCTYFQNGPRYFVVTSKNDKG